MYDGSSSVISRQAERQTGSRQLEIMDQLWELKQNVQMEGDKKRTKVKYVVCMRETLEGERMQEMWLLTSPINKICFSLGGGRREQLVVVLVGTEGARVVPLACVHDSIGHHDMTQRVVQVAVKQAALVFGRRHVVLGQ